MKFEFEITEAEFTEAMAAVQDKRSKRLDWYSPLRISGIAVAAIGMALLFGANAENWIAPALLVLFGLFVPVYPVFLANKRTTEAWAKYSVVGPVAWEFLDDTVVSQSSLSTTRWSWYAMEKLIETKNLFLLITKAGGLVPITKRAFTDRMHENEFRTMVRLKVDHPKGAFPVAMNYDERTK